MNIAVERINLYNIVAFYPITVKRKMLLIYNTGWARKRLQTDEKCPCDGYIFALKQGAQHGIIKASRGSTGKPREINRGGST